MLLRAVIAFLITLYSSSSLAAIIIVAPCVEPFWFDPSFPDEYDPVSGVADSSRESQRSAIISCRPLPLLKIDEGENSILSAYYNNAGKLVRATNNNDDGGLVKYSYPDFHGTLDYIQIVNGDPYVLDKTNNTVWKWDSISTSWLNLNTQFNFPVGTLGDEFIYGFNKLFVTISTGVNTGIWELGVELKKVSSTPLGINSILYSTTTGIVQVYQKDYETFEIKWLDESLRSIEIPFSSIASVQFEIMPTNEGLYVRLYSNSQMKMVFVSANNNTVITDLALPQDWDIFHGCNGNWPNAFCSMSMSNGEFHIYRLTDGEYLLDGVILDQEFLAREANNYKVFGIGRHRFIFFLEPFEGHVAYSLNDEGLHYIGKVEGYSESTRYTVSQSVQSRSDLYWLAIETLGIGIGKITVDGNAEYQTLSNYGLETAKDSDLEILPGERELDGSANNEEGSSSEELISSLNPCLFLLSLFILGLFRRFK